MIPQVTFKNNFSPMYFCLSRNDSKTDIESAIGNALYRTAPQGYLQLKKTIESEDYLGHYISFSTYYYHLKALEKAVYLTIRSAKGKKSDIHLTLRGQQDLALGTFGVKRLSHSRPKRDVFSRQTEQEKRMRAYQLLVVLLSTDYPPWRTGKEGISVQDVLDARCWGFAYCHLFLQKGVVREAFRVLKNENLIKRVAHDVTPSGDKRKFDLVDDSLKDFTRDLSLMHNGLVMIRLFKTWRVIRRPSRDERVWCESLWGKKTTNQRLGDACEKLGSFRKCTTKGEARYRFRKVKRDVEFIDKNLSDYLASLKRKYGHLIKKYPSLTDALIESFYPKFLQDQVKAYRKDTPYPQAVIISSHSQKAYG